MNNNLPVGWVEYKLGDVFNIIAGGTPSTSEKSYYGGSIAWITPADLSNYNSKYISKGARNITEAGLKKSSAKLIPKGSILFSSRAPIGYVVISANDICTNQGFKNLVPKNPDEIYNEYVYYYLLGNVDYIKSFSSGTTFAEISASSFRKVKFIRPPLSEQKRIAGKIDKLFADINNASEILNKSKKLVKQVKQSLLHKAFNGELYKTSEWKEVELNKICNKITDGTHQTPKYINHGVPFISVKDIRNNTIYFDKCKYISEEEHLILSKRCNVEKGDVLITKSGTIGRTAIVNSNTKFSLFVSVALLKVKKEFLNSEFLMHALSNYISKININNDIKGGIIKNLHIEDLKKIIIPLPTLPEQEKITSIIEYNFDLADNLDKFIDEQLIKINQLKKTILKAAFEGKL